MSERERGRVAHARLLLPGLCCALLAACGPSDRTATAPSNAAPPALARPTLDRLQATTRGAYGTAYYRLVADNRSVAAKYRSYLRMNVPGTAPNASAFHGSPSELHPILSDLEAARIDGSGDAALDAAVDGVLAAGDRLVDVWTPLDAYYASKGFLEDHWARAGAADDDMRRAFIGLLERIDTLGTELDRVQDALHAQRSPRLKEIVE